ncbi:class I SAM-dependent methyltransferase [Leptospira interrogans]|uniref:class I SAM-dependent methyltransferase n=1 Tax=Leptospira interrogans TaxID=173 RepID=UPI0005135E19|nr:methyltransferase domain-containing protein [Leptospira interrogans]KGE25985.1 D-mycarose 3-C-methyltransferase [Leptospira interrogans serovar Lai]
MQCRLCKSKDLLSLIDFGNQPIVHNLIRDRKEGYDRYPFHLMHCVRCGFVQIENPIDPNVLYENYFTVSGWKNQPHVPRLVEVMESIFCLGESDKILEIGCNDGSFLDYLREKRYSNLVGIEPTLDSSQLAKEKGHKVFHRFWNHEYAKDLTSSEGKFDLVVTRQVLEHISDLEDFMQAIHFSLKDNGGLIIEIPDSEWNLDYLDYSLWEEHVNYFTIESLRNLLALNGFQIIHSETTLFSGKALIVYCEKSTRSVTGVTNLYNDKIMNYGKMYPKFKSSLQKYLDSYQDVVLYGCGARSCNFVNFLGIKNHIKFFIDDQKEKQNVFVPGCELEILNSENIFDKTKHILLGVNTENEFKVLKRKNLVNSNITYHSILPPSKLLPDFWKQIIYD